MYVLRGFNSLIIELCCVSSNMSENSDIQGCTRRQKRNNVGVLVTLQKQKQQQANKKQQKSNNINYYYYVVTDNHDDSNDTDNKTQHKSPAKDSLSFVQSITRNHKRFYAVWLTM